MSAGRTDEDELGVRPSERMEGRTSFGRCQIRTSEVKGSEVVDVGKAAWLLRWECKIVKELDDPPVARLQAIRDCLEDLALGEAGVTGHAGQWSADDDDGRHRTEGVELHQRLPPLGFFAERGGELVEDALDGVDIVPSKAGEEARAIAYGAAWGLRFEVGRSEHLGDVDGTGWALVATHVHGIAVGNDMDGSIT